jgi:hypothetical protein
VTNFVFLDGHVESVSNDIAIPAIEGLSTVGGGEIVQQ